EALADWNGPDLPDPRAYDALARDLQAAPGETVAEVAKRLNYYESGLRSLIMKTNRKLDEEAASIPEELRKGQKNWNRVENWLAIKRALPDYTGFYLLRSVDLKTASDGSIVKLPPSEALYQEIIGRTFWISLAVTLL